MSELTQKIGRKKLDQLERLLALQMLGHTPTGCARLLNVSRETIYQLMKEPLFCAMKERERGEMVTATSDAMVSAQLDAVRVLQDIVTDFRQKPSDRMQAALYLAELSAKFTKPSEVHEAQLAKLLFPEVVADEPEPVKELPATTSAERFDDLFQQLHTPEVKTGE